ncbi:hypothetical protein WJX84_009890 [Apatococcus fuscideae]
MLCQTTKRLYKTCLVDGGRTCHRVDPRSALSQTFSAVRSDVTAGDLHDGPFSLIVHGRRETFLLVQFVDSGQVVEPDLLRAGAMQMQTPIHSYLFNSSGLLLLANTTATSSLKARGMTDLANMQLADLLIEEGRRQPDAAEQALHSILVDKQPAYRITLRNRGRSILFEMWWAEDLVLLEPAVLVNSFDITSQKEVEQQLEDAKRQLLIQNEHLELRNVQLEEVHEATCQEKARLLEEQQGLQDRLKKALELHLHPKTSVDTATVADKIISMFDDMLQGKVIEMADVLELRNAANGAKDLRQPVNFQEQLMHRSGLSQDVGASMIELLQGDSHSSARRWASSMSSKRTVERLRPRRSTMDAVPSLHRNDISIAPTPRITSDEPEDAIVQVDRPLVPELEQLLQAASDTSSFQFDMFQLCKASINKPLSALGFFVLSGSGLLQMFNIPEQKLLNLLSRIEEGYPDNPYHNRVHAASVFHMMHLLIHNGLIQQGVLDGITMIGCYLAALCHDYDHSGFNNDYLIKTRNPLAITYNDISPNENHHVAGAYTMLMSSPDYYFSKDMAVEDRNILRAAMIELVLATDMKKHFSVLSQFQMIKPTGPASSQPDGHGHISASLGDLAAQQKMLIAQVALKCADLGHLASQHELHRRWVDALTEEFFRQGDQERAKGMHVSPLMDRNETAGLIKSQVGFFEIVALPLFKQYVELLPMAQPVLDAVKANYQYWHHVHHLHDGCSKDV